MESAGFLMLPTVAALMLLTGLPAFLVMTGVAIAFAAAGVLAGAISPALLGALPGRQTGLLESDLLQALPLYVLMGGLLNRLHLADIVFRAFARLAARLGLRAATPELAALGVGALLAPMNGSVGASAAMLNHLLRPRLAAAGRAPADSLATIAAASTLGVTVPPSLVIILLGDAMMRAHTEALNATGQMIRIVNTQDVFRGAILPAALVLALFALVGIVRARRANNRRAPTLAPAVGGREWLAAGATVASILTLLGGVATGRLYAVEAAATGAVILAGLAIASGALRGPAWRALLAETMAVTGALFALFVAATTLTLVFRAFGTDRVLTGWVATAITGATGATLLVLGLIALCALVLDAFEIIVVVVPLLMPGLLMRAPDAVWVSVLTLLVLQASFLLPPSGYAILFLRGLSVPPIRLRAVLRAVLPYLLAQLCVLALVAAWPGLTHLLAPADTDLRPVLSPEDAQRRLQSMPVPED